MEPSGELDAGAAATRERLARERRLLEESQRSARIGSWEWDIGSGALTWTAQMYRICGLEPGEWLSYERFLDLVHADDRPHVAAAIGRALQEAGRFAFHHRIVRPDGSERTLHARGRVVRDEQGAPARMIGSGQDVTEQKRAEDGQRFLAQAGEVLAASLDYETALHQVAELAVPTLADWCVVDLLDEQGALRRLSIVHRDPAKAAVAEELMRRYPAIAPDQPHTVWSVLRAGRPAIDPTVERGRFVEQARDAEHLGLLEQLGFAAEMVLPLVAHGRALGAITLVLADNSRQYGADAVALAEELSRRAALAIDNARLYREARLAESRYRDLFEGVADALLVSDADGRILDANLAAERLLRYARDDLRGRSLVDLTNGAATETEPPRPAWDIGGDLPSTQEVRREDGAIVPVEVLSSRVDLPGGPAALSALRDISDRRRLERLQRDFLAMVTHDLRNPVAGMRMSAQLLQRRGEYNARLVAAIIGMTDRMQSLIDDLADVIRLEDQRLELRLEAADLMAIAREEISAAQALSDVHDFQIAAPHGALAGVWDVGRIRQVVQNLLGNAIAHAPDGGPVIVRVERAAEDGVRITVSDVGPGIAANHLPRLFERFYRTEASGAGGLGLGLYISRMLVEAHGGRITVASEPGHGTTFLVDVPRVTRLASGAG